MIIIWDNLQFPKSCFGLKLLNNDTLSYKSNAHMFVWICLDQSVIKKIIISDLDLILPFSLVPIVWIKNEGFYGEKLIAKYCNTI